MAESKDKIKVAYPLPVYNYRVTLQIGGKPVVVGFSEVTGLSVEYESVTYKHGLSFLSGDQIIPGMRQPVKLTLKRGIVSNATAGLLYEWIDRAYSDPLSLETKRDILIDLCDEAGEPVVRWKVRKALPVKLEAPTFSAESNDVALEAMELAAAGLTVDYQMD